MGLFDKKYCDICGEKIGFLGNCKLEDGNLCKDCARKLSPFFSNRRHSTVEDIKNQLAYRAENERKLAEFSPCITFEGSKNVHINPWSEEFIVTGLSDWRSGNPDLIHFSQVTSVHTEISENKEEIFYEDSDGNRKSYDPPRYECDYAFNVEILVDSPWFTSIELELSDGNRPNSPYTDLYREYEQKMHKLSDILQRRDEEHRVFDGDGMMNRVETLHPRQEESVPAPQPMGGEAWKCPSCGTESYGKKFCENCGGLRPFPKAVRCASCGYAPENQAKPPKFCPECGKPFR